MDWIKVTRLPGDIYRLAEPLGLVDPSWKVFWVNSYLVIGCERVALIDSGLGFVPIRPIIETITHLPVLVLNTHSHWDHCGSNAEFDEVAIHGLEAPLLLGSPDLDDFRKALRRPGSRPFLPKGLDPETYAYRPKKATRLLTGGELIDLGGRSLKCLSVPGHSPGGICYLEEATGRLFIGDCAYAGTIWVQTPDAEPERLATGLRRLLDMDPPIRELLPGHEEAPLGSSLLTEVQAGLSLALSGSHPFRRTRLGRCFDFPRFSLLLSG
ncbi:MAG TPA: MBL fold metallo-hydrolase [Bacillota bacterium]|jgi:glyoxylase-like metal-dependent hydrolase (beta-lactamase superfamily II)